MKTEKAKENRIFADNLNNQLYAHQKSQADLAKHLGVSTASVAYWCTAQKMPRMDKVQAICDWLHIKKSDLIEEHDSEDELILVELHKMNPKLKSHVLEYIKLLNQKGGSDE